MNLSSFIVTSSLILSSGAALGQPAPQMIADLETGTSGLSGKIEQDTRVFKQGRASGRIDADLANVTQSAWVTISKPLDFKFDIRTLSFWIKSEEAKQITVRLVDSTGQNLQVRAPLTPGDGWQQVSLSSFESGPGFQAFGGANDKKVHWPAKSMALIVEKNGLNGGKGTVWIDAIQATLGEEKIVGKLEITPVRAGNIFLTNEPVQIGVETQGDEVTWIAQDFWGAVAGQGSAPVKDKRASINPGVTSPGYYEIQLEAKQNGASLAKGATSFVVTTPLDLAAVPDSPFGLMTHFAQGWDVSLMPLIARCGVKNIRDELYWDHVEKTKGQFTFSDRFNRYMDAAKAAHISPLIVLSFGNKNYDHTPNAPGYGNAPYTDEGRAAYARYGQEILKQYGPQINAVEIWNEYNGTFGKGPAAKDKPRFYFEMLKVAYEALKKSRPDITVVGISAVATPFPYFESLFKMGALNYMDALSLHPYRTGGTPEGLERQMNKLQALVKRYSAGKSVPIWITELGWYVKPAEGPGSLVITEADQAKYLVRAIALTLSSGVEKFYWYHAQDDKAFPNSGILRSPENPKGAYTPKPAYAAYATMTRQLNGAKFEKREATIDEETYSLLFRRGTEEGRVLWSLTPGTLAVKADQTLTLVDLVGGTKTVDPAGDEVTVELSDSPIYLWGKIKSLPPMGKSKGKLLADSEEDFSSQQGDDGWSYGYFIGAPDETYDAAKWQPMPEYRTTIWGYDWIGKQKYLVLSPSSAHPSSEAGKQVWAVRRWTSGVAGNVLIKGRVNHGDKGDGTTVRLFVDGKEIWKNLVGGGNKGSAKFEVTAPVAAGSNVDLSVDPGPGPDIGHDATSSSMTITLLP